MPLWHRQTVGLSRLLPMILLLGLWLLCTLPAPRLFLDRLSAHQGDTAMLSCLVPLDAPMTRIVFCKDGKEISVQPKEGNKLVYDSPYTVSRESSGTFSCRYQLKDDNNQENNSLSSDPWDLHVDDVVMALEGTHRPKIAIGVTPSQSSIAISVLPWCQAAITQGRLGPIVGLAIMAGLALALLGCFLMKTGCIALQDSQGGGNLALTPSSILGLLPREPGPERSSPAAEDQIQSSAQPNDKVTGVVGCGQERDWLEPGSFCHKLQGATPTTPTCCASQPMGAAELALGAGAACGAPWLPLCIGVIGGTCRCFQMLHGARAVLTEATRVPFQPGVPSENQTPDTVVTGARADQAQNGRGCCSDVRGGRKGSLSSAGHPDGSVALGIPSAPQARMSPTLAASLIGAPGKEMVMEPVNQPARTSVWVNR
ncbi:unnamed protein product [Natator depressus]